MLLAIKILFRYVPLEEEGFALMIALISSLLFAAIFSGANETLPTDASGIMNAGNLLVTPDGRSYGYYWHRALSDLYLVSGVS